MNTSFERSAKATDEWCTPIGIIQALGEFDLDPCAPVLPLWPTAKNMYNKNGESELAGKEFFDTDKDFRVAEFMHFCSKMLRPEPKDNSKGKHIGNTGKMSGASCMIVFCAFEQQMYVIEKAKEYGFEIKKDFFKQANEVILQNIQKSLF